MKIRDEDLRARLRELVGRAVAAPLPGSADILRVHGLPEEELSANARSSDIVGRLGGDGFAVLLALVDGRMARGKARRLAAAIAGAAFRWQGLPIAMSVAYGAYPLIPREDAQVALAAADRAKYRQKRECEPR